MRCGSVLCSLAYGHHLPTLSVEVKFLNAVVCIPECGTLSATLYGGNNMYGITLTPSDYFKGAIADISHRWIFEYKGIPRIISAESFPDKFESGKYVLEKFTLTVNTVGELDEGVYYAECWEPGKILYQSNKLRLTLQTTTNVPGPPTSEFTRKRIHDLLYCIDLYTHTCL